MIRKAWNRFSLGGDLSTCAAGAPALPELGLPAVDKSFARHETFHVRYGWLKKGYDAAAEDPLAFTRPDAAVRLGVGKNMVRAIRFWCRAFKITEETSSPESARLLQAAPTEFARSLLSDGGLDPYLERPETMWLLHWMLLRPSCLVPVWHLILGRVQSGLVAEAQLVREIHAGCQARPGWDDIAESSIKKDVDCFLRMYSPRRAGGKSLEDAFDSPFAELGLVTPVPADRHSYVLNLGPKPGLKPELVAFCVVDHHIRSTGEDARTALLGRFTHDAESPGRVLRLAESDLRTALTVAADHESGLSMVDVAGRTQLQFHESPKILRARFLERVYCGEAE